MIIYKTTNLINSKIYIGKDKYNNPEYYGSGIILNKSIKKYGKENFVKEILEYCNSELELNEREIYWINFYQSFKREIGYNLTLGGTGGNTILDSEKRKKINQKRKEKNSLLSKEERSKKFGVNKGKVGRFKMSDESKKKISEKNKGENNGMFGKEPWNKGGCCYSEEQIKHFSDSHIGKIPWNKGIPASDEQKGKQSEKMIGRKQSDETKKRRSESLKNSEKKKLSDMKKIGKPNGQKGKIVSEETKEKIRISLIGKSNKTKGMIWIYNENLNKFKRVKPEKLNEFLSNNWIESSPRKKTIKTQSN